MRQLLALGAAEIDRLLQEARAHLEHPPGHQVVEGGHAAEQGDVLERAADALERRLVRAHVAAALALVGDRAFLGPVEAVDDVEHRRLAGAVGADDGADLALQDVEADVGERRDTAEAQSDAVDLQQHLAGGASPGCRVRCCRRCRSRSIRPRPAMGSVAARHVADRHLGVDPTGAAVLEGHLGRHRDRALVRVEGLDQRPVALVDHAAAHLAGPGQLAVVGVQLLVEQEKAADPLRPAAATALT